MPKDDTDDTSGPVIVLFRHDLRVADNLALRTAADDGRPILPVYVLDESVDRKPGGASRWWLHHSLKHLSESLSERDAPLVLMKGKERDLVPELVRKSKAGRVHWNRRYDPARAAHDRALADILNESGVEWADFDGHILHDPEKLQTGSGGFFKVYSPFWRALVAGNEPRAPVSAPRKLNGYGSSPKGDSLSDFKLLPTRPDWSGGLAGEWTPGEAGAHERLDEFLSSAIDGYGDHRDMPGEEGTSRLSPHLAHGEITPFQIWHALSRKSVHAKPRDIEKFRQELVWRDFSYHLLFHNPDLASVNYNRDFDAFPWQPDGELLKAWQRARTGYPIVDAGMRQLWETGWMHNRVRMVVASFLIKHLLQHWRAGEDWFWDTLVDADPASNAASWQWVAGSGADAAPYFRIFNPVLQGEKFDADGAYVRRFVPELKDLPTKYIHKPWEAPREILARAGVKLGETYPVPVVEHQAARDRALDAYKSMKGDA